MMIYPYWTWHSPIVRSPFEGSRSVYLGIIEDRKVLPSLYKALKDKSAAVRRTAGDCLSDLGFKEAMGEMSQSLSDKNKLVRWRAAMFLYENREMKRPSLILSKRNRTLEFRVALQVKMAIDRTKKMGKKQKVRFGSK